MISIKNLKELEKFYMHKLWTTICSDKFLTNLKEIELFIQENYFFLDENWDEKNKLKIGVERLIRFHIYRNFEVVNIFPSPISSDMAIELKDVILNIDAKTIDMNGNPGDDSSIHFQKNQITFNNVVYYKRKVSGFQFSGISFPARLVSFFKGKPVLTFFVTVNYFDAPVSKSFNLKHLSLCCVPHDFIVKEDYSNKIISNYKTHEYIGTAKAKLLGSPFLPKEKLSANWIPFSIKDGNKNDAFLDPNLDHPIFTKSKAVWKKINNSYCILTYGGSARISKQTILKRYDSQGKEWNGVLRKKID